MSPIDNYETSVRVLRRIFKLTGQDILADNYTPFFSVSSDLTCSCCFGILDVDNIWYVSLWRIGAIHSGFVYFWNFPGRYRSLTIPDGDEWIWIYSTFISQILFKYIWAENLRYLLPTVKFFADIHQNNSTSSSKYYSICHRYGQRNRIIVLFGFFGFTSLYVVFYALGLLQSYLAKGNTVHVYIPGVYEYSRVGFIALSVVNTLAFVWCALCMMPTDMFFYFVFANIPIVPDIVRNLMDDLNILLRRNPDDASHLLIKHRLLHYIGIHHKFNELCWIQYKSIWIWN